ncbi:DUF1963 domain-containing protein [Nocardiopsis ganjiahuensis]|uniref:DUF1963 domain-containing protein n=1 Tax=Nocardiopsis ganjiahuensis TaxID=239984 RepID=UPI00308449F6
MDSFQTYRDHARGNGVPEEAVDLALRLARPQIELSSSAEGGGVLAGRYGGLPSLPADIARKDHTDFIASVDCAALPPDALDLPLPRDGQLLFFATRTDADGAVPADRAGSVVHVPAGAATTEREPEEEGAPSTEPRPLYARAVWSLPMSGDDAVLADEEARRLYKEYELEHLDRRRPVWEVDLLLGGYSCSPHDPVPMGSSGDDGKGGWVLLAQGQFPVHEDPDFTACPFWIIRYDDLRAVDFGAAVLEMPTYH